MEKIILVIGVVTFVSGLILHIKAIIDKKKAKSLYEEVREDLKKKIELNNEMDRKTPKSPNWY